MTVATRSWSYYLINIRLNSRRRIYWPAMGANWALGGGDGKLEQHGLGCVGEALIKYVFNRKREGGGYAI